MDEKSCALHAAIGNEAECPRAWCAFWERGGAVVEGGCEIERLGLDLSNVDLAHYLLDLRHTLEQARDEEAALQARRELTLLAPPDLSGA
jgi:hypothetical protein